MREQDGFPVFQKSRPFYSNNHYPNFQLRAPPKNCGVPEFRSERWRSVLSGGTGAPAFCAELWCWCLRNGKGHMLPLPCDVAASPPPPLLTSTANLVLARIALRVCVTCLVSNAPKRRAKKILNSRSWSEVTKTHWLQSRTKGKRIRGQEILLMKQQTQAWVPKGGKLGGNKSHRKARWDAAGWDGTLGLTLFIYLFI